ncbi:MAG: hypothetical protein AB7S78_05870 [Candidatus Omnitrophota bacterium]
MNVISENRFNEFEKELMSRILEGESLFLKILREQFSMSSLKKREYTGAGVFTFFLLPDNAPKVSSPDSFQFGDAEIEMIGLKHGAGCIVFVKNGLIDFLEVYSFEEDFPKVVREFKISNIKNEIK